MRTESGRPVGDGHAALPDLSLGDARVQVDGRPPGYGNLDGDPKGWKFGVRDHTRADPTAAVLSLIVRPITLDPRGFDSAWSDGPEG